MANVANWTTPTAYATAGFTAANFNSLATGSHVVAASASNSSGALYADVSFSLVVGGTTTVASFLALYILPLNQDGTTYGDGSVNGALAPGPGYLVSSIGIGPVVTSGNAITGTFRQIVVPSRNFKFDIVNNLTVALNASAAAVVQVSYYSENLNGS